MSIQKKCTSIEVERSTLFLFVIILFFNAGCNSKKDSDTSVAMVTSESKELITPAISEFLKNNLPEWSVVDTSDYVTSWWSFYDKDQIPYAVVTDMNDDQLPDYGLIMKKADSLSAVLLISSTDTFVYRMDKEVSTTETGGVEYGLSNEPPGRIDHVVNDEPRSLILTSNGIALMAFEEKLRIYYWQDGRLNRFLMVE